MIDEILESLKIHNWLSYISWSVQLIFLVCKVISDKLDDLDLFLFSWANLCKQFKSGN